MAAYIQADSGSRTLGEIIPAAWQEKIGECFWGTLCLFLFMVLGPFSAPIVLGYIFFGKICDQSQGTPTPAAGNR